ncbi:hypothetical protein ACHAPJ_009368 [Fusarium lateritium]
MKSFTALALVLAASASATKFSVSGDGFFKLNGKQLITNDGTIDFQSKGTDFTVNKDGTISLPSGQKLSVTDIGDVVYGSGTAAKGFAVKDGKLTWAYGGFYACPTKEIYQDIRLGADRTDGIDIGDDCSALVLSVV